jgi:D-3-phosphoglycerate dehydrogenase
MKIINLDPDHYSKKASSLFREHDYVERKITRKKLINVISRYEVIILRFSHQIDKEIIKAAKNLKVVATNATGVDHIDVEYLKQNKIKFISLNENKSFLREITASSEHTWALMMTLIKNINSSFEDVKNYNWRREKFIGTQLHKKTVGILGLGRNGLKISKYARAFGMNIIFFDKEKKYNTKNFYRCKSLNEILKKSDILFITIPLNSKTKNLLNKDTLKLMKTNSIIVNTSRGEIINETDLLKCLSNKTIAGAALDVLKNESDNKFLINNKLIKYAKSNKNLIITPHIAGATKESWEITELFVAEKICQIIKK